MSGALSLSISLYVLSRRPRTWALKGLFLFGLAVSLWEFAIYLHRTAPDPDTSALFFTLGTMSTHLSLALYLFTVSSIQGVKKERAIVFIPAAISIIAFFFVKHSFYWTGFGWSYTAEAGTPLALLGIGYLIYCIVTPIYLLSLMRRARSSQMKRKYSILFVSFIVFQVIGVSVTNFLIILDPSFPPLGGVLNLLTFLFIGYALLIREESIPVSPFAEKDFAQVYSSFLTAFYNFTSGTGLGERSFQFVDFIERSMIKEQVSLYEKKISFRETENLNIAEMVDRNLKILETNFRDTEIVNYYMRVLNAAYQKTGQNLEEVIMAHEDFLKESDLIYGVAGGEFLEKINEDGSLRNLDDIEASLKIYKRLLLLISNEIRFSLDFKKKLGIYHAAKGVTITDYGEISTDGVKEIIGRLTKAERLSIIIESFNPLVGWAYERVLTDPTVDAQKVLQNLSKALVLNRERAVRLNIIQPFLERLSTRIEETPIHRLYSEHLEELVEKRTDELREVQRRLLQAERMAAIGETAAMVGHDLRNPLQAIVNMLYLARRGLDSASSSSEDRRRLGELLRNIGDQVAYMDKIVSDLQDYSRPLKLEIAKIDLRQLIDEVISQLAIPESIKVSIAVDKETRVISVDPAVIRRVLTNLITNATQAMPEGGQLTIAGKLRNRTAIISVEDTGVGISKENLNKIFKPLFTTKSKGQGFGLAVSKRLIEAHGGRITLESEEGRGTRFTIEIPL